MEGAELDEYLRSLGDECPAGGDHEWADLETWDHRIVVGCDNCGAQPRRDREELP